MNTKTNWTELGLPADRGQNAFTSVPPRGIDKPCTVKKCGPKTTRSVLAAAPKLAHALRLRSPSFNVAIPSAEANARTNSIAGWALDARSQ